MPRSQTAALLLAALCAASCRPAARLSEIDLGKPAHSARLLRGFYPATKDVRWRWTAPRFSIALDPPAGEREVYLEFEYGLPEELLNETGSVSLIASVNGVEIGRESNSRPGHYTFTRFVPARALSKAPATVEFELDRSTVLPGEGRLIGLNAIAAGFKRYEATLASRNQRILLQRQGYASTAEQLRLQIPEAHMLELKQLMTRLPAFDELRFHNVPVHENPLDLWAIQQIVWETQPEFVLATGTAEGGLPLYLAQTLDGLGLDRARVLAIDTAAPAPAAAQHFLRKKYVEFLQSDPVSEAAIAAARQQAAGRPALVILRPTRKPEDLPALLRAYSPLVRPGGYLIVEETDTEALAGSVGADHGPWQAIRQFLSEPAGQAFEADRGREMALFTRNSGGFLRRR